MVRRGGCDLHGRVRVRRGRAERHLPRCDRRAERTHRADPLAVPLPDNGGQPGGYAGATMFSPPAVARWPGLRHVRPAVPPRVTACHAAHGGFTESCEQPGAFLKSIVAFDARTGEPRWSYRVQGHEPWMRACGSQPAAVTWCPAEPDGEKWDLGGSGANVMWVRIHGRWRHVVGSRRAGYVSRRESGVYVVLDARPARSSGTR